MCIDRTVVEPHYYNLIVKNIIPSNLPETISETEVDIKPQDAPSIPNMIESADHYSSQIQYCSRLQFSSFQSPFPVFRCQNSTQSWLRPS